MQKKEKKNKVCKVSLVLRGEMVMKGLSRMCGCCAPRCFSTCLNHLCFLSPLIGLLLLKKGIKMTDCFHRLLWDGLLKTQKLWSPIGKKPIDSLKRTPCYTKRFWVSLPPTHPGVVPHEEGEKIVCDRDEGEKPSDGENVYIGCRAAPLCLLSTHFPI